DHPAAWHAHRERARRLRAELQRELPANIARPRELADSCDWKARVTCLLVDGARVSIAPAGRGRDY
ncbi:MAG TPA: hypothetical protein VFX76_03880, partial [Roseiflexaceae bacterium]|nr:hypothetical protein [Roseiflexaceae bacterium]